MFHSKPAVYFAIFVLSLLCAQWCSAAKLYEVTVNKFQPTPPSEDDIVNYGTIRLTKVKRNTFKISGTFYILHNMGQDIIGAYELLKMDKSGSEVKMMGGQAPMCDFLKTEKMVYPDLQKESNLPPATDCPFPKGNYTINNYNFDENKLPDLIMPGEWHLKLTFTRGTQFLGGLDVYSTIKKPLM